MCSLIAARRMKRRKHEKKLVVVLMAAVMAMTAVTGCGSNADDAKNDTQASKTSESETSANADQEAAMHVADLIDAIYVQERTDDTDKQCKEAKEAWDKLTDAQKELVEGENADPDYFGRDTGDASRMIRETRMISARTRFL